MSVSCCELPLQLWLRFKCETIIQTPFFWNRSSIPLKLPIFRNVFVFQCSKNYAQGGMAENEVYIRGDYDYCRVPGNHQFSPLDLGEDISNLEPKKLKKIQIHQYGQTKGCYIGVFGMLSPNLASILC